MVYNSIMTPNSVLIIDNNGLQYWVESIREEGWQELVFGLFCNEFYQQCQTADENLSLNKANDIRG